MTQSKIAKREVRAEIRRIADLVQREVDRGAKTVEEIHRSIAAMPLDVLERLDLFEKTVKDVRKVQSTSIGAIYDLIHRVNHEVNKLAKELLDGRDAPKRKLAAKPVRKAAPARKPVAKPAGAYAQP